MAAITVMFMDSVNGVQNFSYQLKDDDLQRLYKAKAIALGTNEEMVDKKGVDRNTIEGITNELAESFVKGVIQQIYYMELEAAQEKAKAAMQPIGYELQK